MKKIWFISCGAALIFLVAIVFAADKKPPTPAETSAKVEELAKQVDSLQGKVKELEQRLAKMEKVKINPLGFTAPVAPLQTPTIVLPRVFPNLNSLENSFADPSHPPKIWGEGEFNGWKYYTIPLSTTERGGATELPLATR